MIYCNERNGNLLSPEELKKRINTSFPDGMPEVYGWHLVDEVSMYPELAEGQIAVQDKAIEQDGKWFMTYLVKGTPKEDSPESLDVADKYAALEKAVEELAYIVSSLEIERMERAEREAN